MDNSFELDLKDHRVVRIQEKFLPKGGKVTRVFIKDRRYEVHFLDRDKGFCKTSLAVRGRLRLGDKAIS